MQYGLYCSWSMSLIVVVFFLIFTYYFINPCLLDSVFLIGAKLPLYAYKRVDKIGNQKALDVDEARESPVAFLDSLLLGEVIDFG